MAEIIEMPKLSDTMVEGVIAAWHKQVGDKVESGELLAEIETDKATMELESFFDGIVLHIGAGVGDALPIRGLLAIVGEKGEDVSGIIEEFKNKAAASAPAEAETKAEPVTEPVKVATETATQTAAPTVSTPPAVHAPAVGGNGHGTASGRVKASPLAKAMAKEQGVDLFRVPGTGDGGRIVKRDIEAFLKSGAASTGAGTAAVGVESYTEERVSQMRKTIARRLSESKFSAPHFYLTMEINMGNVWETRKDLNEVSPVKISFNDIIIRAVAAALRKHPKVNASWLGDKIRYNEHVHIGMAVAVDDGLLVPVIRFADTKGLAAIATESKDLATRAREKKLQPQEWEGNTFSISNLGMFGIEEFTAIINPPDACILAVGGIIEKPIVENGEIKPGRMMKVTLSCDHRVVDGALGSDFLRTLKHLLENPVRILI